MTGTSATALRVIWPLALMATGASGGLFFATDDVHATYEELKARGVEFTQEPTEHSYGTDVGLRDPFGNPIRIVQLAAAPSAG